MLHDLKGSPELGRKRIEEISAAVNARFGSHVALPLNKVSTARVLRLPFGIFELDWRSGGGLPLNRISRIWGRPSSLKTTTGLRLIRNAQHYCRHCKLPIVKDPETGRMDCACPKPRWTMSDPSQFNLIATNKYQSSFDVQYGKLPEGSKKKEGGLAVLALEDEKGKKTNIEFTHTNRCEPFRCLLIDTEGTTDEAWVRANGVDPALLLLVGGNWAEQVLDLTEEFILSNEFDLVVMDSLDMLTPGDTIQKALTQTPRMADKANIMTRAMQKWTSAINTGGLLNRYSPTIVIVCQVRSRDIGKPWASLGPSGGWAVGHGISLDVKMTPKKYEYKEGSALFGKFEFKIAKSKVGGFPQSTGVFRFWLRPGKGRLVGDTEDLETVLEAGEAHDFLKKEGSKWVLESAFVKDGKLLFKSKGAMTTFLNENVSVYMDIRNRILSYLIGEDITITLPSEKLSLEEEKDAKRKTMKTVDEVHAERAEKKKGKTKSLDEEILDYA
jgi:RecA/RadA recombinase